jgi:2-amino-4-hydroxy-6-hydroxymethyldihydropteridine diphosphokinase
VTRAFIGLGSNLGDRVATLVVALDALDAVPGIRVEAVSRVYESEPWGIVDQPAFANAVAELDVGLDAVGLLAHCQRIEQEAGRVDGVRNGPRPLDIDLLLFGSETLASPGLAVPHPRLLVRDFVVTPLLEIACEAELPDGTRITREKATEGRVTGVLTTIARAGAGAAGGVEPALL